MEIKEIGDKVIIQIDYLKRKITIGNSNDNSSRAVLIIGEFSFVSKIDIEVIGPDSSVLSTYSGEDEKREVNADNIEPLSVQCAEADQDNDGACEDPKKVIKISKRDEKRLGILTKVLLAGESGIKEEDFKRSLYQDIDHLIKNELIEIDIVNDKRVLKTNLSVEEIIKKTGIQVDLPKNTDISFNQDKLFITKRGRKKKQNIAKKEDETPSNSDNPDPEPEEGIISKQKQTNSGKESQNPRPEGKRKEKRRTENYHSIISLLYKENGYIAIKQGDETVIISGLEFPALIVGLIDNGINVILEINNAKYRGFIHRDNLSWCEILNLDKQFPVGKRIKCMTIQKGSRFELSVKDLKNNPWEDLEERLNSNSNILEGEILKDETFLLWIRFTEIRLIVRAKINKRNKLEVGNIYRFKIISCNIINKSMEVEQIET